MIIPFKVKSSVASIIPYARIVKRDKENASAGCEPGFTLCWHGSRLDYLRPGCIPGSAKTANKIVHVFRMDKLHHFSAAGVEPKINLYHREFLSSLWCQGRANCSPHFPIRLGWMVVTELFGFPLQTDI